MFPSFPRKVFWSCRNNPPVPPVIAYQQSDMATCAGERKPRGVFHYTTRRTAQMGLFSRDIKTMNDLFVHQLQDVYYAEKQLVKALPTMAKKAADPQLKQSFLTHLEETRTHVTRLEQVFQRHGAEIRARNCPAIDGSSE
jgi:hypothetical protein